MSMDDIPETGRKNQSDDGEQSSKSKMLMRLVAGGFFLVGGLNLLGYILKARHENTDINALRCLWLSVPLLIGAWVLVKTNALADRLDEWLEQ